MLRELTDALEALSERTTLVLHIEDLHWSDPATIDWLSSFARRRELARVLIVATYRPGESGTDLIERLASDLQARKLCTALDLPPLDESTVATYVMQRFPPVAGDEAAMQALAHAVHLRTEGPRCSSSASSTSWPRAARSSTAMDDGAWRSIPSPASWCSRRACARRSGNRSSAWMQVHGHCWKSRA